MRSIIEKLDLPYKVEEDFDFIKDNLHSYTYNTFMGKAISRASILVKNGWKNRGIMIQAEHSADTVISLVAVLLSGNYYALISPEAPEGFVAKVREQVELESFPEFSFPGIENMNDSELVSCYEELMKVQEETEEDNPLYMVFTSGSTGIPKGIIKTHANMWDFIQAYDKEFDFDENTVLGNQAPFYFDASAKDIYLLLYKKCKMVIIDSGLFMKPKELVEYLNREQVTTIQWVPSALSIVSALGTFKVVKPHTLKSIFFVGERFPVKQLRIWMEVLSDAAFINLYGSSEMAGICAFCMLDREEIMNGGNIPIGNALSNCEVFLWDEDGQKCITESGQTGEIRVRSKSLARRYLFHEKLSDKVFLQDEKGICYCTGDSACYDEKGRLVFVGRTDCQIKHMGHRIELEEIETAAVQSSFVTDACCIYHNNKIHLFVSGEVDKGVLTTEMKKRIPEYMIPHKILVLDEIPLNQNGKKDRIRLQELTERRRSHGRDKRDDT